LAGGDHTTISDIPVLNQVDAAGIFTKASFRECHAEAEGAIGVIIDCYL